MVGFPPYQTEEAFLLRSLKEVVMVWNRGTGQASLNLSVKDGKADLQLGFQLGQPWDPHLQQPPPQHHHPRTKTSKQKSRDNERAAAHQVRKAAASADPPVVAPAVAADATEVSPHYRAAPAQAQAVSPPAVPAGLPPPLQANAEPADYPPPPFRAAAPAAKASSAVFKATPPMNVNDELCPDIEYGENDGKTAFKCIECKLIFIPMSYMHGL